MGQNKKHGSQFSIGIIFRTILFLLPFFIIGVLFFKGFIEFQPEQEKTDQLINEAEILKEAATEDILAYYLLPNGHGLTVRPGEGTILVEEIDPAANRIVQTEQLDTDIFVRSFATYQQNGLVFITKSGDSDSINGYYYESGKELTKLDVPDIQAEGFLESHVLIHQGVMYLLGNKDGHPFTLYSITDLQSEAIDLTEDERVVDLVDVQFYHSSTFTNLLPAMELGLYDQSRFMMVFSPETGENFVIPNADSFWETEEDAISKLYQGKDSAVILLSDNQLVQYDTNTHTVQEEISTPDPIYYPRLFQLDNDLTLVMARKTAEETSDLIGYVFNQSGDQLVADLTTALQDFSISYDNDAFSAQTIGENLYIVSDNGALSVPLSNPEASKILHPEMMKKTHLALAEEKHAEVEKLTEDAKAFSISKLVQYIREDSTASVLFFIIAIWIAIPLLIIIVVWISTMIGKRKRERILNNDGVIVQAVITQVNQTGTYINEQPQVRLQVEFTHQHDLIQQEVKKIANMLNPPKPGDFIDLLYDPRSGKVYLWRDERY